MKLPPIVLAGAGACALLAAIGFGTMAGLPVGPLKLLAILFFDASPNAKSTIMLVVLLALAAAIRFVLALVLNRPKRSRMIVICGVIVLAFTIWAVAVDALNVYLASSRTGVTKLEILAPSIGETLLVLALGLLTAAAVLAGNRFLMGRARRRADQDLQAVF